MSAHQEHTYDTVDAVFAGLVALGVSDVIVSPGSRSTPLAVTASLRDDLQIHVVLDERSAGFVALGMAKASGRPVALVCTSGSATANYLPAVVEANRDRVPLIVLTADRPPGALARDASQSIDQLNLYGSQVRAFIALPVAQEGDLTDIARQIEGARIALAPNAGPVHVNCPFDKPLEPPDGWRPGIQPPASSDRSDREPRGTQQVAAFLADHERGVVVAGPRRSSSSELDALDRAADRAGWPILADPLSGLRNGHRRGVVATGELLLRSRAFAAEHSPDAVLRIGGTPTGRATQNWLESVECPFLIVDPDHRWTAEGSETVLRETPQALFESVVDAIEICLAPTEWLESWTAADTAAGGRRHAEVALHRDTELAVTAAVLSADLDSVWVASSMPIRHVDVMMKTGSSASIFANRGANGIDGTLASATGVALATGARVTVLIGDLAFLHDVGSLTTAMELGVRLTIVVIDNNGGAIFSMLPIADSEDIDLRRLFITPHSRDLVAVASGFGVEASSATADELGRHLTRTERALVEVIVVPTDPASPFDAYERMVER